MDRGPPHPHPGGVDAALPLASPRRPAHHPARGAHGVWAAAPPSCPRLPGLIGGRPGRPLTRGSRYCRSLLPKTWKELLEELGENCRAVFPVPRQAQPLFPRPGQPQGPGHRCSAASRVSVTITMGDFL